MADIPRVQDQLFAPGATPREKYSALVVGRSGWGPLIRHELVTVVSQNVPGAVGLGLRKALYPMLLGACGRNVVFGQNVVLRHPHKIRIADNVVIDDNCLIDAKGDANAGITIASGVFVGRNTILSCKNGDIELHAGVNIGFNCEIFSASLVSIGSDTLVAAYTYLVGGDHAPADAATPVALQERISSGIRVGAGCWIGAGVQVLDGVAIGDGAIVGAGAVVRDAVAGGDIVAGVPARVLGRR